MQLFSSLFEKFKRSDNDLIFRGFFGGSCTPNFQKLDLKLLKIIIKIIENYPIMTTLNITFFSQNSSFY